MFLDNTACNLASLNVLKFYDSELRAFDVDAVPSTPCRICGRSVLEISVLMGELSLEGDDRAR